MKFRCEREALAEALSTASRATSGRSAALPVLTGLRLEVTGDRLSITGSDLDLTIQASLEVGGEVDGGTVVPARLTSDIVRSLGSGKVEVEASADDVTISNGRSNFTVRPLSFDDYPKVGGATGTSVTLPSVEFGDALRQVVKATSNDEQRQVLTGVLMTAEADGLRMVATDSYRLAVRDLIGQNVLAAGQKVLVPGRALTELQRLVNGGDEVVMRLGEREAGFEVGNTRLTTRLIDGEFPDYKRLVPPSMANTLTVEREVLLDALRRVKLLAKDQSTPVRLSLGGDTLRLTAITQDVGNASEEVDATYVGTDLVIAFNPEFLIAGVEVCAGQLVVLTTNEPGKPAVLRGATPDGTVTDYLYLLMPVRVPETK
ncbi:MAG: DNA polymerase III subunit beta [Ilumatobacteraceae bacterium]